MTPPPLTDSAPAPTSAEATSALAGSAPAPAASPAASTSAPAASATTPDAATTSAAAARASAEPVEHLIQQLYGFGAVRRALGKAAHQELATPGFGALAAIYRRGACRVSEIATDLQVDLSVASRQIASLVSAGFIERRPDPEDGRAHLLHLTDAGNGALTRAHHGMVATLADALVDWDPADVEALSHGLGRLVDSFTRLPSPDQEVSS